MPVAVVGLSHRTAPVEVRERFVFSADEGAAVLAALRGEGPVGEAVLLSTCNRTEVFVRLVPGGEEEGLEAVERALAQQAGRPAAEVKTYLYRWQGREAVRHLLRVAGGIDSMVVGEAQIQGQVRDAYAQAAALDGGARVVGPVLSRLFETALRVGGRIRSETTLGAGAASVPSAAVELAGKIFGSLRGRRALVLGAGEMSELAVRCFQAQGVRCTVVASRSAERAQALAARLDAAFARFEELPRHLPGTDIIAAATGAPHPVLERELVERALPGGPRQPLLIVDIALPRDVEPGVGEVDNVFLYDLDDLRQIVDATLERRRGEIAAAERIVDEGVEEFWAWYRTLDVVPVIRALRDRAEEMRQAEFEKALRRLGHLSPDDREAIDVLTRQLLNKVLHPPTARLREAASSGRSGPVLDAARYLFELDARTESGSE